MADVAANHTTHSAALPSLPIRRFHCRRRTSQEHALKRMRHWDGSFPFPASNRPNIVQIASPEPEQGISRQNLWRSRPSKKPREVAQGARADKIERSDLLPQLLKPAHQHLRVCKSKFTNHFRNECSLLYIGLDQKQLQVRPHDLEGESWEAGPGPYVGEPTLFHRQDRGAIHRLAEVTI